MKLISFILILTSTFIFSACGKQPEPVAMNLYNPNSSDEPSSSISVEITQKMIDDMKRRGVIKSR